MSGHSMLEASPGVEAWMRHIAGVEKLNVPEGLVWATEAVELNKERQHVLSTFGDKVFPALVGFVDMRGFSRRSQGKSPAEVQGIAGPFITAVVDTAKRHQCIIDKTIGDEVMIIMPLFGADAVGSDAGLESRNGLVMRLSSLVADLALAANALRPSAHFSSGFAMGRLVLGQVGSDGYSEWTCYGTAVNVAKRIQAEKPAGAPDTSNLLAVGAIDADEPEWAGELEAWKNLHDQLGPLRLLSPTIQTKELKGVGQTTFLASEVAPHDWYLRPATV